jgi:hypothetical protein
LADSVQARGAGAGSALRIEPLFGIPSARAEVARTAAMTADAAPATADLTKNLMMASLLIRFVWAILHKSLRKQF